MLCDSKDVVVSVVKYRHRLFSGTQVHLQKGLALSPRLFFRATEMISGVSQC